MREMGDVGIDEGNCREFLLLPGKLLVKMGTLHHFTTCQTGLDSELN